MNLAINVTVINSTATFLTYCRPVPQLRKFYFLFQLLQESHSESHL